MTSNAVAVRDERPIALVREELEKRSQDLLAVLPNGMSVERFMRVSLLAVSKNPDLLACTAPSIIRSIIEAAEIGLEPTGSLSRAWLVPFKNRETGRTEAQLIIGYQGLQDLARDSGKITKIWSDLVYEGDEFEETKGSHPTLRHKPMHQTEDPTKIQFAYAAAKFSNDPEPLFEVMSHAQVEGIRAKSRGKNSPSWTQSWGQMARKTATRRLCNSLPLTQRAASAIERDDEREYGPAPVAESRSSDVKRKLLAKVGKTEAPVEEPEDAPPPTDAPGDALVGEVLSEPAPDESASQPTKPAGVAVCGDVAADGIMDGAACNLKAGHASVHKSANGSWPK